MAKLVRLERWSDRESNSGTRLDFCKVDQVLKAEEYREVSGREELDLSIDPAHSWMDDLPERDVIRTVFGDGGYDEWRVWTVTRGRRKNNSRTLEIFCRSPKYDLSDELAIFEQANGVMPPHHELADLSVDDFIDALIALSTWPSDYAKGTIEPTTRHTWALDWETYHSALTEAATVSGGELDVTRNGTSGYTVDLLDEVRSGERTEIRYAANALEADIERDWTEAGTLIYPKGEGPQGAAPSIADMRWFSGPQPGESVPTTLWRLRPWDGTARISGFLSLLGATDAIVCTEADQFNGLYFGERGNAAHEIVDSAPADSGKAIDVTFAASTTDPGFLNWLLADSEGNELLYVPVPSKIATHGRRALVLERDDIPGVTNMVTLPFIGGKEPVHYTRHGDPTVTVIQAINDPLVKYGTAALKVEAGEGEGIGKFANKAAGRDSWMVSPNRPHLSFQVYGHLISGSVRFEVLFEFASPIADGPDTGTLYQFPTGENDDGSPIEARAVQENSDFHMTIEPARFDFSFRFGQVQKVGYITNLELRVTAREAGTEFVLDAWQVVNHPTAADKIVAGSSAARLWDAACRAIQDGAADPKVRLRTTALDLDRLGTNPLDDATYSYGEVHPGVTARIVDPGIGLSEERRILSVRRDLKREALTQLRYMEADSAA